MYVNLKTCAFPIQATTANVRAFDVPDRAVRRHVDKNAHLLFPEHLVIVGVERN